MIAQNYPQPEIPAVDRLHPCYDADAELLCSLNPSTYLSLDLISKTLETTEGALVNRVHNLRRKGYEVHTQPGPNGVYARLSRHQWSRANAEGLAYFETVYGDPS